MFYKERERTEEQRKFQFYNLSDIDHSSFNCSAKNPL